MTEGANWLASAFGEPNMKIVLETAADEPQVLMEWATPAWSGQPNETYYIDGAAWRSTGCRQEQEPDGSIAYHVSVTQAEQPAQAGDTAASGDAAEAGDTGEAGDTAASGDPA